MRDLQPVRMLAVVPGTAAAKRWAFYLERYHYLGFRTVGEKVGYLVCDRQGRDVAGLLFGAAAWRCQVRDNFLNWNPAERATRLSRMANNTRFLILPWVRAPHLASHVLGPAARFINADWQAKYGHGLDWLETPAQKEVNDWGNLCPQSQELLKYRKGQRLKVMTCSGLIVLKTCRGYSAALRRWVNPARERWALQPKQRVRPELQSRLGFTATATGSYQKAAQTATRWGSPVSDDLIHALVQRLGTQAAGLRLPEPESTPGEPEFSLVIMMDGWMGRQRGRDWGAGSRQQAAERVNWKEVKAAVIHRLEQRVKKDSGRGLLLEKYGVAAPPDPEPVDFGAAVQAEARRRGLGRARKVYVVIDGAVWLWNVKADRFRAALALLDFHHASEHLWAIAHVLHGAGSPQGRAWVEPLRHQLRHGKEERVVRTLESLLQPKADLSKKTQAALRVPVAYFQTHREHIHYQKVARQGGPSGSGSVESFNRQLQDRFKRTGQFWQPSGLRHLLAVEVLLRNNNYNVLWN